MKTILKRILLAVGLVATATAAVAEETNRWSFDIVPYLWVASVDAETAVPSVPPSTPPGLNLFDTRLSAGAMVAAQVRYRSVGLFVDFAWLQLDTEGVNPGPGFSSVGLKSDFIHSTAALSYTLPLQGKFHAQALAGARLWNVSERLEFTTGVLPGFKTSGDETWVDPMIGADLRYDLGKNWSLVTKGFVGGFGVSSDLDWEAFGGVNYQITDWCSAILGYRYLHEDYTHDGFSFKLDLHGFLLGVGFHF